MDDRSLIIVDSGQNLSCLVEGSLGKGISGTFSGFHAMAETPRRCPGDTRWRTSLRPFKSQITVAPELDAVARMWGTMRFQAKSVISSSLVLLLAVGG